MRILIADDDARVGKHIRQALLAEGYAVDFAQDGDEALWLAENNTYDAIVLDVMMPLRDGFTIARSLRRKNDQTPVLFLTAKGELKTRFADWTSGVTITWSNPFRSWNYWPACVRFCADNAHRLRTYFVSKISNLT